MRYLFIYILLFSEAAFALDRAPNILRVCLDNNTSIATICWNSPSDACNSFKFYKVYSSENNGPWKLEASVNNINISCLQVPLPDINSFWRFKITAYTACNGLDSFVSNIQTIDQTKPGIMELDSVSFDQSTQTVMAGWKKNPSPDTKGYRLYSYSNSVNNFILDVDQTSSLVNGYNKDNPVFITLATFDSCNLFSPISNPQKPAYLNGNIDTCGKTITLNWSSYEGWAGIRQFLYQNVNRSGFFKERITEISGNSLTLNNIKLGDSICYLLRTENISTGSTSASNTLCFFTRELKASNINYLNYASVKNNSSVDFEFTIDKSSDLDSVLIERSDNNAGSFFSLIRLPFNSLTTNNLFNDAQTDVSSTSYVYRFITKDKCNILRSTSNIGKTILLNTPVFQNGNYLLSWNFYKDWENGVLDQNIEYSYDRFTWNFLETLNSTTGNYLFSDQVQNNDSVCFRIVSNEADNSLNKPEKSVSNVRCVYAQTDFYFPGTINPNSHNNTFRIYGLGYDKTRASLDIYNRWGERIFSTHDLEKGWDGKIDGSPVEMGNYIYKASFFDQQNNVHNRSGSILIIR